VFTHNNIAKLNMFADFLRPREICVARPGVDLSESCRMLSSVTYLQHSQTFGVATPDVGLRKSCLMSLLFL
jgi:hypothetical protein